VIPVLAFAQAVPSPVPPIQGNVPQGNITSLQGVLNLFCIIFSWAFYFLIALAVIFVLVAAFKYLTAGGDPEKVKAAAALFFMLRLLSASPFWRARFRLLLAASWEPVRCHLVNTTSLLVGSKKDPSRDGSFCFEDNE